MATSTETEKYEVLETIGKRLKMSGCFYNFALIRVRSRIIWHNQKGSKSIRRSCTESPIFSALSSTDAHIVQILCRKEIQYVKMSQKEREQLHAEFSILNSLKHPNIVGYYHREHLKTTQELYLYMEYCGGGDLSKEIQKLNRKNQYAPEEYVWSIFSQLIAALYRCHYGVDAPEVGSNVMGGNNNLKPLGLKGKNQVMILHRDLKPENGEYSIKH